MSDSLIEEIVQLGQPPWPTIDPFLFCVHHDDQYPEGNEDMGPNASLEGRHLGMDFEGKDGWRMYHGDVIPGFPSHPHRGFETVTLARRGYIDHSDSLGATARFGHGDVQWMTAGRGIVHSEMFPLLERDQGNHAELFQLWINLPSQNKFAEPHFSMFWNHQIPRIKNKDAEGRCTEVTVIAGAFDQNNVPPTPPPESWANDPAHEVAIWSITLDAGASLTLPAASSQEVHRMLYFFRGSELQIGEEKIPAGVVARIRADREATLRAPQDASEVLLLQGRPIGEPVAHYGPFVMNTRKELQEAMNDYNRSHFGGWPWDSAGPVHSRESGRFAVHADGRKEEAE